MKAFVLYFFSLDFRVRAAVIMALFIIVFWWILGKIIIRLASFFPYLLRGIFRGLYLLIEMPVSWIHERTGSIFFRMDNGLAGIGDKIDNFLQQWNSNWRNPKTSHIFTSVLVYGILLIWIYIPYSKESSNIKMVTGQKIYLSAENQLVKWLESHDLYEYEEPVKEEGNYEESEQAEKNNIEGITMKVITKKDPLSIRDVPSAEKGEILERIKKKGIVVWKGEMAFGRGSSGSIEPWIKVETSSGTVGWAGLIYLRPANKKDFKMKLQW